MVLARSNDSAIEAFSPGARIRFLYADVSETTRRLARSHGYPADASRLLGMALAGSALVGLEIDQDHAVHLIQGPVVLRQGEFRGAERHLPVADDGSQVGRVGQEDAHIDVHLVVLVEVCK